MKLFKSYSEIYTLDPVDRWCRRFVLTVGPCLLLWITLYGCAMNQDYWYPSGKDPVLIREIKEVEHPGGIPGRYIGFANLTTGVMELKIGLPKHLRECVISHERMHFNGWTHDGRVGYATDCGDGTILVLPKNY